MVSARYLFDQLFREEWRLHARLFGGWRFAAFPAFLALLAAGTATFFALAGSATETLLAGLHVVVALVGLQVGSIGLVGRDALGDLLGDVTLLVYSARTLPVSERRLLAVFVAKDVLYYALLFIAPLVVGVTPLVVLGDLSVELLPRLLASAWLAFAFGVGVSLLFVGLATKSRLLAALAGLAVVAGVAARPAAVVAATPFGLYADPSAGRLVGSLALPVVAATVGVSLFEFDRGGQTRTTRNQFRRLAGLFGARDEQGLLAKSLLDVARSSGSLWKVLLSQGLVFGVVAVLLGYLPDILVGVRPSPGLTLGSVLALGAFTTYNWLCQYDDTAFFGTYPIDLAAVFEAKLRAFLLLAIPAGGFYLALGGIVFGPGSILVGAAVYVPVSVYVFGVTAYVAGLRPTELLFDTPVFVLFSGAMMAVLLPLVVLAVAYPLAPGRISLGATLLAAVAGLFGLVGYRRAGPKWSERARTGDP